jgi:thiol-disulfide isomerase/thioredoxin
LALKNAPIRFWLPFSLVESLRDLLHQLDGRQIGSEVQLGLVRGAERLELSAELTGYPGRASQIIQRFIGAPENYWETKVPSLEDGRRAEKGELAGKVTVLMFFGPSCEDCPRVATVLNAWRKRYASRGAKLYGITAQPGAEAKAIARRFGMEFEVLWTRKGSLNRIYSVTYFPTVFLIHDEVIRDATFGIYPGDFERMEQKLSELLDERRTP